VSNPESTTPRHVTTNPRCSEGATWSRLGMGPTPPWTPSGNRNLTAALAPAGKPLPSTATMWNAVEPECTPTPDPVTSEPEIERAHELPTPSLGEAGSSLGDQPESPVLAAVAAAEVFDDTSVVTMPADRSSIKHSGLCGCPDCQTKDDFSNHRDVAIAEVLQPAPVSRRGWLDRWFRRVG
jgi:hypothetical protein